MRILVTGGAGYVGSVSVERLLEAGHDVVVLDDLSTGHRARRRRGDPRDGGYLRATRPLEALLDRERIEAILHCAARSLVAESIADPAKYYRENVAGGVALLEATRAAGIRRVVFSSTAAVYGVPERDPDHEDAPLEPINPYGETKRTFEGALALVRPRVRPAERGAALLQRRRGVASGTASSHDPETHLIPSVLRAVEADRPLTVFGTDYPTPGRDERPRLHPRRGPRRRPPRRARGDRPGRSAGPPTRSPGDGDGGGRRDQPRQRGRVQRPRGDRGRRAGRRPADPDRRPARAGRATRRSSSPRTSEPGRCSAGPRGAARSTR